MYFFRLINIAAGLLVITSLALAFYGIFHSFDWTDEAWATSLISNSRVTVGEPWGYQYLLHPFFHLLGGTALAFRFVRFVLFVALGLYAANTFNRSIEILNRPLSTDAKVAIYITGQIGTVLAWTWMPRYFAYNELASLGVQLAVLLVIRLWLGYLPQSEANFQQVRTWIYAFSIGAIIALLYYAKFTSAILAGFLCVLFLLYLIPKHKISLFSSLFGGFVVALSIPVLSKLPIAQYSQSVWNSLLDEKTRSSMSHSSDLLGMYLLNLYEAAVVLLFPTIVLILLIRVSFKLGSRPIFVYLASFGSVFICLFFVWQILQRGYGPASTGYFAATLMIVSVGLAIAFGPKFLNDGVGANELTKKQVMAVLLLISLAPFGIAFGTNNALFSHFAFEATLWTTLYGTILVLLVDYLLRARNNINFAKASIAMLLIVSILSTYFLVMNVRNPYRAASIRITNFYSSGSEVLSGIGLTQEEQRWVNWLGQQAKSLGLENSPTISLRSPGALLAFNNSNFASPWLDPATSASYKSLEYACENLSHDGLVIIQPYSEMSSKDISQLQKTLLNSCGLSFPKDFKQIAHFESEDSRFGTVIWKEQF